MDKDAYFGLMKETSVEVNTQIEMVLEEYKGTSLELILKELPERRKKKPQLRPLLARLCYQICSDEDWKKVSPALAAMELHNVYLYIHNWIFDNKNLVWNSSLDSARARVSDLIIAASIIRELSENALEEGAGSLNYEEQQRVIRNYRHSLARNYLGFHQDLGLTIEKLLEFDDESFLKAYEEKSRNQSGSIYELTARIGVLLGEGTSEQVEALSDFGFCVGTGLHIANDLGDFAVPSEELEVFCKPYQDQLADIREGRLTLPIYYTLKYGSEEEKAALREMIGNYNPTPDQITRASKAVITSGSYEHTEKVARNYYKKGKRILQSRLKKSENRDALSIMISSIRTNKYLHSLKSN